LQALDVYFRRDAPDEQREQRKKQAQSGTPEQWNAGAFAILSSRASSHSDRLCASVGRSLVEFPRAVAAPMLIFPLEPHPIRERQHCLRVNYLSPKPGNCHLFSSLNLSGANSL
jgi:hypothetical protein